MKKNLFLLVLWACAAGLHAGSVVWFDGQGRVTYVAQQNYSPVVQIALGMFSDDMKAVTGHRAEPGSKGKLEIIELSTLTNKEFKKLQKRQLPYQRVIARADAFYIGVHDGRLVVMGDNGRGTAYGILELSRMAGVSPWVWWGDVVPEHRKRLETSDQFTTFQQPSVEFRGVFLNDEDWSLRPWATRKMGDGRKKGREGEADDIGPRTYRKVFELLLRLRANTIWPAMHEGTTPFFLKKGNREVADSFCIYVGSSHCEPMLRNNVGEWDAKRLGSYNFFTNRQHVLNYWSERVELTRGMEAIYTLGMRGIHDGAMEGARTMEEKVEGLSEVIAEQHRMLEPNNPGVKESGISRSALQGKGLGRVSPSVFIPYKEVLDIYEQGVRVPDDVMLMWCDDNYGYLTRLPDSLEQQRSGGNGIYYHLSYWGRPHDYLWLSTTQPGLIYEEMTTAYQHGARRMWIVNIHDPKVATYQLSLFLDMAWNISPFIHHPSSVNTHLEAWLQQQFGRECGRKLLPVMQKFYQLTTIRRPEFMGWSQVELDHKRYPRGLSPAGDSEFNALSFGDELQHYLDEYRLLRQQVETLEQQVRPELRDAFFAAVKYPVYAAAAMATMQLEAQEARHLARPSSFHHDDEALASAARSVKAWRELQQLTQFYNQQLAGGKWEGLMSAAPRALPVFEQPALPDPLSEEEIRKYGQPESLLATVSTDGCVARHAADYTTATEGVSIIPMLGHSMQAVVLPKGAQVDYKFSAPKRGNAVLRVAVIPKQPVGSFAHGRPTDSPSGPTGDLRFAVSIDDGPETIFSLKEPFRSERWKQQVLRQQAVREVPLNIGWGTHHLTIRALDEGIILDQWMLDYNPKRQFYRFPL